MHSLYNRVAGQSVERLAALSDGIFAVAMTLLVLDLRVPAAEAVHAESDLLRILVALSPRLLIFLMSVMTLGIFWVGQQTQLNQLSHADRNLSWLHFTFLATVTALPFSTRLLAEFITFRTAFLIYWFNILIAGAAVLACWIYAERAGLIKADAPHGVSRAMWRRVVVAQLLYALGAALGCVNIPLGIGFIVLVQLNYAIAPRLPILFKL
jgi:uncharacterized membrane protein